MRQKTAKMTRLSELSLMLMTLTSCWLTSGVAGQCIKDLQVLVDMEEAVADYSQLRTYVLCPRTIFEIGTLDHNYDLKGFNVEPPIPIRPNMHIKCGDDALKENLCWIATGDLHLDATPVRGIAESTVENVLIEGLVFIGAHRYSLWASKPGDITFRNCEWRDHTKAVAPILLDYFDGSDASLSVTFEGCMFLDNRYFGLGSNTAVVYANGAQNRMTFRKSIFEGNNMIHNNTLANTNSFLVETLGPLTMEDSCFKDNIVGVSNVVVFGNTFSSSTISMTNSSGSLCFFASVFETLQQFDRFVPICVSATSPGCTARETVPPTAAPTMLATAAPTANPSTVPPVDDSAAAGSAPSVAPFIPPNVPPAAPPTPAATNPPNNPFVFPSDSEPPTGTSGSFMLFSSVAAATAISGLTLAMALLGM